MRKISMGKLLKAFFLYAVFFNLVSSAAGFFALMMADLGFSMIHMSEILWVSGSLALVVIFGFQAFFYKNSKDYLKDYGILVLKGWFLLLCLVFFACFILGNGSLKGTNMLAFHYLAIPYFPYMIITLMAPVEYYYIACLGTAFFDFCLAGWICNGKINRKKRMKEAAVYILVLAVLTGICIPLYKNRPEIRYQGHGFAYMHGWSSTDLTDYTVYAENSKLVTANPPKTGMLAESDGFPVMDGAEACYPVYAAIAKACYKDIDKIEQDAVGQKDSVYERRNGRYVRFTNSVAAYEDLIYGDLDLFFGARPSKDQLEGAKQEGIELEITPIGREAFVFFVEEDNPVSNLTSDQIKAIYHGDITNWKELGGSDQEIIAFQRPAGSGSQSMMQYFMGDISLKEPMKYETVSSMEGVISHVAQYANEEGAMGYTFRYFLTGLNQEKHVKILTVDGIEPSLENIKNGSYPLVTGLCLVSRGDKKNPSVEKVIDYCLSEDGQEIIEKTGYARLK